MRMQLWGDKYFGGKIISLPVIDLRVRDTGEGYHFDVTIGPTAFGKLLLLNADKAEELMDEFDRIAGLDGWNTENVFTIPGSLSSSERKVEVMKDVTDRVKRLGEKYGLRYVVAPI